VAVDIHPRFFRVLAQAGTAMAQAEADELESSVPRSLEEAQRIGCAIAKGKTAMLFGACLCGAAVLEGVTSAECSHWEEIGISMGMTYQLVDDCVDLYGNESASGKTAGGDFVAGRLTWPVLLGVTALREQGLDFSLEALQTGRLKDAQISLLQTTLHSAQVQMQLQMLVQQRFVDHRRNACKAGIAVSVMDAWSSDLNAQFAICFPERMRINQQEPDVGVLVAAEMR